MKPTISKNETLQLIFIVRSKENKQQKQENMYLAGENVTNGTSRRVSHLFNPVKGNLLDTLHVKCYSSVISHYEVISVKCSLFSELKSAFDQIHT